LQVEALECRDVPSTLAAGLGALHAHHGGADHRVVRRHHHHPKGVALVPEHPGPSGIVSSAFTAGAGTTPLAGSPEVFVSPTVTVTVAAGQSVFLSASESLGNLAPGNDVFIRFWIAYQPAGGTITNATDLPQDESIQGGETNLTSLSAVLSGLAPGTYQVGLAGEVQGNINVLRAEGGSASALVFQSR
jgi:hypothetical protein